MPFSVSYDHRWMVLMVLVLLIFLILRTLIVLKIGEKIKLDKKHFQVVVVGSGPGGYAAAFRASDLGKKVLLVDRDEELGGVCLNRGCIPSKSLLHISKIIQEARELDKAGISFGDPVINLNKVRDHKNNIVKKLNLGIKQMAEARGVKTINGFATFESNNEIKIETDKAPLLITFENCIIASGSSSATLPFKKDHPKILTSKTALDLNEIPESMLIIGGYNRLRIRTGLFLFRVKGRLG